MIEVPRVARFVPAALLLAILAGAALAALPLPAHACAVCGCGDPTLTTMGSEQPYQNRIRAALEARSRNDTIGERNVNELKLSEQRLEARLAWAPSERVFLLLTLPLLSRTVEYVNLAQRTTTGLGDVEMHARFFLYRDREYATRHLVSALVGTRLPTAALQRESGGSLLPVELQAGTGSIDPSAGVAYTYFAFPWSIYTSATAIYPTSGIEGFRASRSLGLTVAGQYQLHSTLGLRLGVDSRLEGKALEDGGPDPDSGGWISFGSAELLWSPYMDWMIYGSARLPVLNALDGRHVEGPIFGVGVAYDFN